MQPDQIAEAAVGRARKRKPAGPLRRLWRAVRKPLAQSETSKRVLASLLAASFRFVYRTNRRAAGSDDTASVLKAHRPAIAAFWHGQHLLAPCDLPKDIRAVAMFSRSPDAELNALVVEKLGFGIIRGSGGRETKKARKMAAKGGARALIAMKKALDEGNVVAMIADIPHGTPRDSGLGVITLARISGRPVLPVAYATSRRKVLERSWDKTTINLPFGRLGVVFGKPICVPRDADDAEMERKRVELTQSLDAVTAKAYTLADGPQ